MSKVVVVDVVVVLLLVVVVYVDSPPPAVVVLVGIRIDDDVVTATATVCNVMIDIWPPKYRVISSRKI